MAARAAEIHSTMRRALPRVASERSLTVAALTGAVIFQYEPRPSGSDAASHLVIAIGDLRVAKDVDRGEYADGLKTRGVRGERRHLDAHRLRPGGTAKARKPTERQVQVRRLVQVGKAAEGQPVGEHEGIRPGGRGKELVRAEAQAPGRQVGLLPLYL